jgi:hypothetical protein
MIARACVCVALAPQPLWNLLVRWEDQPRWMRDAESVRVLGGRREGAGVRLVVKTRVLGVPLLTEELEVTVWEPTRRLVVAHRSLVGGTGTWTLEPIASGTRLAWVEDLRLPPPLLGEIALAAYRPVLQRLMRSGLERLRRSSVGGGSIAREAGESGEPG